MGRPPRTLADRVLGDPGIRGRLIQARITGPKCGVALERTGRRTILAFSLGQSALELPDRVFVQELLLARSRDRKRRAYDSSSQDTNGP